VLRALSELREAVNHCRRCGLWSAATQGVPGEGAPHAPLMLLGEQPGDSEDLAGHPFVGPAGAVASMRGKAVPLDETTHAWVTIHPSYLLRMPEKAQRRRELDRFTDELKAVHRWLRAHRA
jgi:DNA polymerase